MQKSGGPWPSCPLVSTALKLIISFQFFIYSTSFLLYLYHYFKSYGKNHFVFHQPLENKLQQCVMVKIQAHSPLLFKMIYTK